MLWALLRKELLILRRDLHGLVALFILPVVFIIVMSMALKDIYSPHIDNLAWSMIDQDNSKLSDSLLGSWEVGHGKPLALPADWELALREGRLAYVIRIESGAERDFLQPEEPDYPRIILQTDPAIDAGVFAALNAKIHALTTTLHAKYFITKLGAQGVDGINTKMHAGVGLVKAARLSADTRPTSVQHNVPAWLVFGMFFVVTSIAGLFVEERNGGTLNRLTSLGVSSLQLLFAKALSFLLINCLQAGLMLGVGIYVVPLLGGDALSLQEVNIAALLVILFCISLAAICCALFVAALVRSQAQASIIGPMISILMAAFGGIMVPTFVMPLAMQKIAQFSPMNWALEGLLDVLLRGGDVYGIGDEVSYLLMLATASVGLAYFVLRFKQA